MLHFRLLQSSRTPVSWTGTICDRFPARSGGTRGSSHTHGGAKGVLWRCRGPVDSQQHTQLEPVPDSLLICCFRYTDSDSVGVLKKEKVVEL